MIKRKPEKRMAGPPYARVVGSDEQLAGLGGQEGQPRHLLAPRVLPPLVLHVWGAGGAGQGQEGGCVST